MIFPEGCVVNITKRTKQTQMLFYWNPRWLECSVILRLSIGLYVC